jgi:hypothetical protein
MEIKEDGRTDKFAAMSKLFYDWYDRVGTASVV